MRELVEAAIKSGKFLGGSEVVFAVNLRTRRGIPVRVEVIRHLDDGPEPFAAVWYKLENNRGGQAWCTFKWDDTDFSRKSSPEDALAEALRSAKAQ